MPSVRHAPALHANGQSPTVTATMLQGSGNFVCSLPAGDHIGTVSLLFQNLEEEQIEDLKKRFGGQQLSLHSSPNQPPRLMPTPSSPQLQTLLQCERSRARELTLAVAEQGEKVRTLKGQKAEKAVIGVEITKLLELKKLLSLADGKNPEPAPTKGKKNAQPAPTPAKRSRR